MSEKEKNEREYRSLINKENGKKGGPKTLEGKIVISKNAVKHGILSSSLNVNEQISAKRLYLELCEEFRAITRHQCMVVEELVDVYIKLARCKRTVNSHLIDLSSDPFDFSTDDDDEETEDENEDEGEDETESAPLPFLPAQSFNSLEPIILRYEPQLQKRMIMLIGVLKKLQEDS